MHSGWIHVCYERDLINELTQVAIGDLELGIARRGKNISIFDARCPHRGAHLCFGGKLNEDSITCPFHGFKIGIGKSVTKFHVQLIESFTVGGLVFARPVASKSTGMKELLVLLDSDHFFVPGFELHLRASAQMVIENAFDQAHFQPVHDILNQPYLATCITEGGAFQATGTFTVPSSQWQGAKPSEQISVPFTATAFSPTIVLSQLGGEHPYYMLTTTQPISDRSCIARLSLIMPHGSGGNPPSEQDCTYLLGNTWLGHQFLNLSSAICLFKVFTNFADLSKKMSAPRETELFVREQNAQEEPVKGRILWIHGYTLDGSIWAEIWERMPEFNHFAPDLPGHGKSRRIAGNDALRDLTDSIIQLANEREVTHLVGISFGGMIAPRAWEA